MFHRSISQRDAHQIYKNTMLVKTTETYLLRIKQIADYENHKTDITILVKKIFIAKDINPP